MSTLQNTVVGPQAGGATQSIGTLAYRVIAYTGLMSISGSLLYGFQWSPAAPAGNFGFNALLYAAFVIPHLLMTRSWFKKALWGNPAGHPRERQVYIMMSTVTWLAVVALARPMPGLAVALPPVVSFLGVVAFLTCVLTFFQGVSFEVLDGMLGVPGAKGAYSHGPQTPLFTEGPYAEVRHPMYRAAALGAMASLLIHPEVSQLFWNALIVGTFLAFIPVEERQLIAARGDDYRRYTERVPYRILRGIW